MDLKDKQKTVPLLKSFSYAIFGIRAAVTQERNMRIHIICSMIVIGCSILFSLSRTEWMFVILAIGGMISLEMVNSALERLVDLITEDFHPLAKQAKDMAAGAVFVYALMSVLIGLIIFLPHIAAYVMKVK